LSDAVPTSTSCNGSINSQRWHRGIYRSRWNEKWISPLNLNSRQFLQKRDKEKAYIGEYQKRIDVKGHRSKAKKRKQAAEVIADAAGKRAGTYYGAGMAIAAEEPPKKKQATTATTKRVARACSKCGEFGHRCDSI
jgi:hypothetical protein